LKKLLCKIKHSLQKLISEPVSKNNLEFFQHSSVRQTVTMTFVLKLVLQPAPA